MGGGGVIKGFFKDQMKRRGVAKVSSTFSDI